MADPLQGFDERDLPGDVRRALGLVAARRQDGTTAQLWLPPRFGATGQPAPTDYLAVSRFPRRILSIARQPIASGTGILGNRGWMAAVNGTVYFSGAVTGTAAILQYSLDGNYWVGLSSADLTVDTLAGPYKIPVAAGDWIDFSASAATTGRFLRAFFVADVPG